MRLTDKLLETTYREQFGSLGHMVETLHAQNGGALTFEQLERLGRFVYEKERRGYETHRQSTDDTVVC